MLDRPPRRVPLVRSSGRLRRQGGRGGAGLCGGPRRRRVPYGRGARAACRGDQCEDDPSGKQWPVDPRCRRGRGAHTHHHIADSVYPSDVPWESPKGSLSGRIGRPNRCGFVAVYRDLDSTLPVPLLRSILVQDALTLNAPITPSRSSAAWLLLRRAVCRCRSSTASGPWTGSRASAAPTSGASAPAS
jgi:hypothetical protein